MSKIIVITSNSLRHFFFADQFNKSFGVKIQKIFIESHTKFELIRKNYKSDTEYEHYKKRSLSEIKFFEKSQNFFKNKKVEIVGKGTINSESFIDNIKKITPDLIITYGCSIIKPELISLFKNKILNVHLGISPYYLGAGTNFHALSNNQFQFFGYSIIYMDKGVDTGEIIHQARGEFKLDDNPHSCGNRLIHKMTKDFIKIVQNFKKIERISSHNNNIESKTFKIADAGENEIKRLNDSFNKNLAFYLFKRKDIDSNYPIIEQKFMLK